MDSKLKINTNSEILLNQLKEIVPFVFNEDSIDLNSLAQHLGIESKVEDERFLMNWAGKSRSIKLINKETKSILVPNVEKSINYNDTNNVFIEGDNLEVLKVLQNSYFNQVDLIYIDPPYNTGTDFVYADNFESPLENYLDFVGLKGSSEAFSSSTKTGRKHSNWLSMIYPRLLLAKNLLKESGIICISIDEHEVTNLTKLCNEVFDEENHISNFIWQKKTGGGQAENFYEGHEYLLIYAKNKKKMVSLKKNKEIPGNNIKQDSVGYYIEETDVVRKVHGKYENGIERRCYFEELETYKNEDSIAKIKEKLNKGEYILVEDSKNPGLNFIAEIQRVNKVDDRYFKVIKPYSIIQEIPGSIGNNEVQELFGTKISPFDNPKPIELLEFIIYMCTNENSLILDFFAGSGSTGHTVFKMNSQEELNRKFVLVQIPEVPIFKTKSDKKKEEIFKSLGLNTIADLTLERLKRAGQEISKGDIGFRHFSLPCELPTKEVIVDSVDSLLSQTIPKRKYKSVEAVIVEMLIKKGFQLNSKLVKIADSIYKVQGNNSNCYLCTEHEFINNSLINEISKFVANGSQVVFVESAFTIESKINAYKLLDEQHEIAISLI